MNSLRILCEAKKKSFLGGEWYFAFFAIVEVYAFVIFPSETG
jgi:hypothetical protein